MVHLLRGLILLVIIAFIGLNPLVAQPCFQIESILVDACGTPEGQNEMVRFQVGNTPLNTSQLNVLWANTANSWQGICQNASTSSMVSQINSTIVNCGYLLEPQAGVLPANAQVILISSVAYNPASNTFVNLADTMYVIFHCSTNSQGNFANAGTGLRTFSMSFTAPASCVESVTYDRSLLVGGDGALANFDAAGNASYSNQGCSAPFLILDPSWTPPAPLCSSDGSIDLNTLITGDPGGTWEGVGVTGSTFNPAGLSGDVDITYNVGVSGCQSGDASETNTITISTGGSANWTSPGTICNTISPLDLNTLITGTSGGTWSGIGVSGNTFDPSGLNENVAITYTVGSGSCQASQVNSINVNAGGNPAWTTGTWCQDAGLIDLSTLVTGDAGGAWSGPGVTGSSLDPSGLSGTQTLTYSVTVAGSACSTTLSQDITINVGGLATWTPTSICSNEPALNLNTLVTGTSGGTWSGTGVSGSQFDPAGLSGTQALTYTVGAGTCAVSSTQDITVITSPDPSWTTQSICALDPALDLNTLTTGTTGGTWSGTGVSGSQFNPSGLTGNIQITYTVGTGICQQTNTQAITVNPQADGSWTAMSVCDNANAIDLNILVTGNAGGIFTGQGIVNTIFTPEGLSGAIAVTYSVGSGNCAANEVRNMLVSSAPPAPVVSEDTSYCQGIPAPSLQATALAGASISWSNNLSPQTILSSQSSYTPAQDVSINLQITQTLAGCTSLPSFIAVNVLPLPTTPVSGNYAICNDILQEDISFSTTSTLTWYSDALGTQLIQTGLILPAGTTVTSPLFIQAGNGQCLGVLTPLNLTQADSIEAHILQSGIIHACLPDAVLLESLDSDLNVWSTGATTSSIQVDEAGFYYLKRTNACNTAIDTVWVMDERVRSNFYILAPEEGFFPIQISLQDESQNADACSWFINGVETFPDNLDQVILNQDTIYEVMQVCINAFGCSDTTIQIFELPIPSEIFVPSGFSPNADGKNDVFNAKGFDIEQISILIFNRWGEQVYEISSLEKGWDGKTPAGLDAPEDVYAYYLRARDNKQKAIEFKGLIVLIR